jgi:mannose-6-phosphate isomerase-like protein (cupin superfamily)
MADAPILKHIDDLATYRIAPDDTVKLMPLAGPAADGVGTSVFFEMWDPQGAQPDNEHAESVEMFIFLKGEGIAYSDEHSVAVKAGDVLVLPKTSVHRIVNTSETERLYAVTIMADDAGSMDGGFEHLVLSGTTTAFDADDRASILAS